MRKKSGSEEVFATIAHQWRQPLSQINSIVSKIDNRLYEKGIEDDVLQQHLNELELLTRHMSHSIDDFRHYFNKTKESEAMPVVLKELFSDIALLQKPLLDDLGISLVIDIAQELPFEGDVALLKQIVITLLNNAKDACIARNVYNAKIMLHAVKEEGFLLIELQDNAGGMSKSTIAKLFEPDFTTKHSSEGTGMGLYMVRKLLQEQFNGDISVKNVDKGASFKIEIPLQTRMVNE